MAALEKKSDYKGFSWWILEQETEKTANKAIVYSCRQSFARKGHFFAIHANRAGEGDLFAFGKKLLSRPRRRRHVRVRCSTEQIIIMAGGLVEKAHKAALDAFIGADRLVRAGVERALFGLEGDSPVRLIDLFDGI